MDLSKYILTSCWLNGAVWTAIVVHIEGVLVAISHQSRDTWDNVISNGTIPCHDGLVWQARRIPQKIAMIISVGKESKLLADLLQMVGGWAAVVSWTSSGIFSHEVSSPIVDPTVDQTYHDWIEDVSHYTPLYAGW